MLDQLDDEFFTIALLLLARLAWLLLERCRCDRFDLHLDQLSEFMSIKARLQAGIVSFDVQQFKYVSAQARGGRHAGDTHSTLVSCWRALSPLVILTAAINRTSKDSGEVGL